MDIDIVQVASLMLSSVEDLLEEMANASTCQQPYKFNKVCPCT